MKKIEAGELVVLLMDIESPETPFFAKTGSTYKAKEVLIDPNMPSGYAVKLEGYSNGVLVDKSAVVHRDDWKNITNAVLTTALKEARYSL